MSSLKRYRAHYKIATRPNVPKQELLDIVAEHFTVQPKMRDADVISQFLFATRKHLDGVSDSNED